MNAIMKIADARMSYFITSKLIRHVSDSSKILFLAVKHMVAIKHMDVAASRST